MKRKIRGTIFLPLFLGAILLPSCTISASILQSSDRNIASIAIKEGTLPETVVIGKFDQAGIRLVVSYSDGSSDEVPLTYSLIGEKYRPMLDNPGTYDIEILYRGSTLTITITMVKEKYLVNFYAYETAPQYVLVKAFEVPYATAITAPSIATDIYDQTMHYTFLGWNKDFDRITEDLEIYANYEAVRYYTVCFHNGNGDAIKSEKVDEHKDATPPTEEERDMEGYDFIGWDRDYHNVCANIDVYGLYVSVTGKEEETSTPSEPPTPSVGASISILNKEEFADEWTYYANPETKGTFKNVTRSLSLQTMPRCNIIEKINSGAISISSSDPGVVSVNGLTLAPHRMGDTIITVSYKGAHDSMQVHVSRWTEPDYAAPKTLTQIMALEGDDVITPEADANHTYSKLAYPSRVKVAVIGSKVDGSRSADKYGNFWAIDPLSNEAEPEKVQVYGSSASFDALTYEADELYYKYVNAQDFLENEDTKAIKVGDILDVIAIRADYKTNKEISCVIRAINGKPIANDVRTTDEVNATEDSKNVRAQLVSVSGKITGWAPNKEDGTKYGNFFIQTEGSKTDPVYVYGATASSTKTVTSEGETTILDVLAMQDDGSWKFNNPQDWLTNEETKDLKVGDKITLLGFRCDYQGTIELTGIVKKYIEPAP